MQYYYITGTSRGIGKAIAERLLKEEDVKVYGISRSSTIDHERYEHIKADLSREAGHIRFNDHSDADKIVLINNAGTLGDVKHVGNLDNDQIRSAYELNVTAPAILTNKFIRKYKDQAAEKIVLNITSGAANRAMDGWSLYSSSKAAMNTFTRVAAEEQYLDNPEHPFKIMAVTPSIVDTQMQTEIRQVDEKGFSTKEQFIEYKETGALQNPKDVAEKFFRILSKPENFKQVIFSVKDVG